MLQIELGEQIETQLVDAAKAKGVSVDAYLRDQILPRLPRPYVPPDAETIALRTQAIKKLMTFAADNGIHLTEGVTVDDLRRESRP